jgi:hypothetical protein
MMSTKARCHVLCRYNQGLQKLFAGNHRSRRYFFDRGVDCLGKRVCTSSILPAHLEDLAHLFGHSVKRCAVIPCHGRSFNELSIAIH